MGGVNGGMDMAGGVRVNGTVSKLVGQSVCWLTDKMGRLEEEEEQEEVRSTFILKEFPWQSQPATVNTD